MKNTRLISFVVLSYNNQNYIKQALESALNQDFHNYEIIVCDDASTDDTWNIINDVAKNYSGSKSFIIKRNKVNHGLVSNVNRAFELSKGDLIVLAAGDDISHSNRLTTIYENWVENSNVNAMCSSYKMINEKNRLIGSKIIIEEVYDHSSDFFNNGLKKYRGCTGAYTMECFALFGPIKNNVQIEDKVLAFRGWLLGGVAFISPPLIDYRIHDKSITFKTQIISLKEYRESITARLKMKKNLLDQYENDVLKVSAQKNPRISKEKIDETIKYIDQARIHVDNNISISSYGFLKRILIFFKCHRKETTSSKYVFYEWSWLKSRIRFFLAKKM